MSKESLERKYKCTIYKRKGYYEAIGISDVSGFTLAEGLDLHDLELNIQSEIDDEY